MKKILYYSDCFVFGGCELVITNIMNYPKINEIFEVHFAYRKSPEYENELKSFTNSNLILHSINILTNDSIFYRLSLTNKNNIFFKLFKLFLIVVSKTQLYSLYNFVILYSFFNKTKPDILHINNGGYPGAQSCRIAVIAAKFAKIKNIIFTVHSLAYKTNNPLDKLLDYFINKYVSTFTSVSDFASKRLVDIRNFKNVLTIENSICSKNEVKNQNILFDEFSIKKNSKIILGSAGLLTYNKRFDILIDSIKILIDGNYNNFLVFIFGEGEERSKLEKQIKTYHLENTIFLPGYRKNIYEYMNCFDIFVLSSQIESFSLVNIEAMSLGKPVISTNVGGMEDRVADGLSGYLVNPNNAHELSEKIKILLSDNELRIKMGQR